MLEGDDGRTEAVATIFTGVIATDGGASKDLGLLSSDVH